MRQLKTRLSILMFLQYFVHGATVPILSLYLTEALHFSGLQAGTILSMSALAAFISPLAGAFIADRRISAPRLYGACHIGAGVMMAVLAGQDRFGPFLLVYLVYMLIFGPTHALSNAIAFQNLPDAGRNFGQVRMWGTLGWIAVAWLFGFFWLRSNGEILAFRLADALALSSISSLLLGLYAFSMPAATPGRHPLERLFPAEAFRVFMRKEVLLLSAVSFLVSFIDRFYYFGTAPFLRQIGFQASDIMPAMSIGQVPEVFAMASLGFLISKFGIKRVLAIGVLMELGRFGAFVVGKPTPLILVGLSFHGFAYAFFFTTVFIYLDRHCDRASRSGVHQLFAIIHSGFGSLTGSLVAGKTLDIFSTPDAGRVDYQRFWLVPTVLSLLALLAVVLLFGKHPPRKK